MHENIQQMAASQDLLQVIICLMTTSFMLGGLVAILLMMLFDMIRRSRAAGIDE